MRGGKRNGAGRPKGAPNKMTAERREAISASGKDPLNYMIRIMRDERASAERRDDMAKAAAPYVHPKLAAIEYSATIENKPPDEMSDAELNAAIAAVDAQIRALIV